MKRVYKLNRFVGLASLILLTLAPLQATDADSLLRISYSKKLFSEVNLNDVRIAIDMWSGKLVAAVNAQLNTNYQAITSFLDKQQTALTGKGQHIPDFISVTATEYLRIKNPGLWEPLFCSNEFGSDPREQLLYLAPAGNGQRPKVATLELADNHYCELAELWLTDLKRQFADQPNQLSDEHLKKVSKPSRAVLDVFFGKAAACIVSRRTFQTMTELNPQLGKKLRILRTSPPLLFTVFCVRRDLPPELKTKIYQAAITLPANPTGRQLLKLFGGTGVLPFKPHYLETVRALMQQNKQGKL